MNRIKRILTAMIAAVLVVAGGAAVSFAATSQNSAQVMIDGKVLTFAQDSQPVNVSGRIMVPYRAIFEYLGLDVDYDTATGAIKGSSPEISLTMYNGNKTIAIKYADGSTDQLQMDVAPFIQGGRTFVPTRFVSEVLGYSVGWDSAKKTVIIINEEGLADEQIDNLSLLMSTVSLPPYIGKTYSLTGDMAVSVVANEDGKAKTTAFDGTISGTVKDSSENTNMVLQVYTDGKAQDKLDMDVIFNAETGDFYAGGTNVTEENQIMHVNIFDLYEDTGVDIASFLNISSGSTRIDAADLVDILAGVTEAGFTVDTYSSMVSAYGLLNDILGNDAFTANGNVYTTEFSYNNLIVSKVVSEITGATNNAFLSVKGSAKIVLNDDGTAASYEFDIEMDSNDGSSLKIYVNTDGLKTSTIYKMGDPTGCRVELSANTRLKETTKKLSFELPKGKDVIDVNDLFASILDSF